mgnify:FL=1
MINSWDKVTARCILRLLPDTIIVFNEIIKNELIEHNHVNPRDVFIGGMAQYDHYFTLTPIARGDFLKKMGIPLHMRFFLYAPVGRAYGTSDWAMIDLLHRLNQEGTFGSDVIMLVRFPPNDFLDNNECAKRPWLLLHIRQA